MRCTSLITLYTVTQQQGPLGEFRSVTIPMAVPCEIRSITRQEWTQAGQRGFAPVLTAIVFTGNYSGQTRAKVGDRMYAIYRTYDRDDETTELYLQYETGVNNG